MAYVPQNFVDGTPPAIKAAFLNGLDITINYVLQGAQTVSEVQSILGVPSFTTPLPVGTGGTGAGDAPTALSNLGGTTLAAAVAATETAIAGLYTPRIGQTAQELAAGVSPSNTNWLPGDIRRYGFVGNGLADDTSAWTQLAAVMNQGLNGYVPPQPTLITSQVTFAGPGSSGRVSLSGYGCVINTSGAIDAIRTTSFTSTGGITFYGLTVVQADSSATGGFNAFGSLNCYFVDCAVVISSTVAPSAGYFCYAAQQSNPSNPATGALWNYFIRCKTRQPSGNAPTYAPFGFLFTGQSNANSVINCTLGSVNYAVGLYNQLGGSNPHALPNAILVEGNAFEGGIYAVIVNGQNDATSQVSGLRMLNNRAESLTGGFLLLQGLGSDTTGVPIQTVNNYLVSSVATYITQSNVAGLQVTVNAMDPSLIPGWLSGANTSQKSTGPFKYTNNASTGGLYDVYQGFVQSSGGGIALFNTAGTLLGSMRYNGTSAVVNLATGGAYQFNGTQVVSAQQTTAVAAATFVQVDTTTAVSTDSTFDGYTLKQVVKALRIHGLLA